MPGHDWSVEPWVENEGELHVFHGQKPGSTLLVLGGVHGDEPAGSIAINQVIGELHGGEVAIEAGTLMLVPDCSPLAKKLGKRFVDRDLNRNLQRRKNCQHYEDVVGNRLLDVFTRADILLDIHTHGHGEGQFLFLGPENNSGPIEPFDKSDSEYQFAASLNFETCIFGWLTAYSNFVEAQKTLIENDLADIANPASLDLGIGTLEAFRSLGGFGVTIECGSHLAQSSSSVAYAAIRRAMVSSGLCKYPEVNAMDFKEIFEFRSVLVKENAADALSRRWQLFDEIPAGHVVGTRRGTELSFDEKLHTVFCYPNAPVGGAWLYLAKRSSRRA